jgi:hypothetical protein
MFSTCKKFCLLLSIEILPLRFLKSYNIETYSLLTFKNVSLEVNLPPSALARLAVSASWVSQKKNFQKKKVLKQ